MRWAIFLPHIALVAAQSLGGISFSGSTHWSNLCGKTVDDANVTGLYSWNPHVPQLQQPDQPDTNGQTLPVEWLATVSQTNDVKNASVQYGFWYSTLAANYSDDFNLGYDVCAFSLQSLNLNAYLRMQDDNGDCLTGFDQACVADLESQARNYALGMTFDVDTQKPKANLTAQSIYTVCTDIAAALTDNFPHSCKVFYNQTLPLSIEGAAWTSRNYSFLYEQCAITNTTSNTTYYHVGNADEYTVNNPSLEHYWYNILTYYTLPLMLVFMPIANGKAPLSITTAKSKLQCLRAHTVQDGSRIPSTAPSPTPYSHGLSGGDIAGIVVGSIVALALIAGAAFFFIRWRKRRAKKLETFDPNDSKASPGYTADARERQGQWDTSQEAKPAVEADNTAVTELSHDAEVHRPGERGRPLELEASNDAKLDDQEPRSPVELPANVPNGPR